MPPLPPSRIDTTGARGFTLFELAVVLIIVALLSGGLMLSLSAQQDNMAVADTERRLNDARDALLGFAAANGRLPCPASAVSNGIESPAGGGACSNPLDGFLPAATLGLAPADAQGYAVDAWGNPLRYALAMQANPTHCPAPASCFATTDGIRRLWNTATPPTPDLRVCSSVIPGPPAQCAGATLADNAVAVIYSRGKNGAAVPAGADEVANGDGDRVFVWHTATPAGGNEFDDLMTWISPNLLYHRLIAAGRLP